MSTSLTLRKRRRKEHITIVGFILPAFLVYGTYVLYGIINTFYYSTLDWSGIGPASQAVQTGFANFSKLLKDGHFGHALGNNILLVFVSLVFQLGFGMILALIINSRARGTRFFRTVYFMPLLLSTVATGILWQLMLDPYSGLFNGILNFISPDQRLSWLGSEQVVMFAVLFVICWQYTPQYMILLRAGMTNVPDEIYEAATIDGASKWQQFWRLTLPLLSGTIKTSAVLSIVGSMKYFDLIWIMTGGGPNGYSELMATYMYKKAFNQDQMGYASTIAGCMVIISLAVIIIFQTMTRSREDRN
ncbi:sugar ABC transporter permease [Marispirochaeta aestuarii]|uniref:carbohydrate ABC transporter permease n=1 Tax=Marispirochaeta aestuarii TaxID=1963862 RepID=UPI0029C6DD30|nr:sugar ABC transporter permease [Marispirochaeta aestuarii]